MVKRMKLNCRVTFEHNRDLTATANMYDGTPFSITVDRHDVILNEEFKPDKLTVDGWIIVQQTGKQGDRCAITLPKPSIIYGENVSVSEHALMPVDLKLQDFNPRSS